MEFSPKKLCGQEQGVASRSEGGTVSPPPHEDEEDGDKEGETGSDEAVLGRLEMLLLLRAVSMMSAMLQVRLGSDMLHDIAPLLPLAKGLAEN